MLNLADQREWNYYVLTRMEFTQKKEEKKKGDYAEVLTKYSISNNNIYNSEKAKK